MLGAIKPGIPELAARRSFRFRAKVWKEGLVAVTVPFGGMDTSCELPVWLGLFPPEYPGKEFFRSAGGMGQGIFPPGSPGKEGRSRWLNENKLLRARSFAAISASFNASESPRNSEYAL